MFNRFIADYLSFTKRDRIGIIALLFLIVCFILLPFFYSFFIKPKNYDHRAFEKAIASLQVKQADSSDNFTKNKFYKPRYQNADSHSGEHPYSPQFKGELFDFDPNAASSADWKRLGVKDKTIATIQKYLSKGGKFYKKEDISKIWGLHEDEVQRLLPYIQIHAAATNEPVERTYEKKEYKKPVYTIAVVDVNIADTASLIGLPGIGSKLSQRIINFRNKLGGFYKVEQVGETFGLPDSTFQKIKGYLKLNSTDLKRININTATADEMKSHPYIRYALANSIIQYRSQHGNYANVADIKKIMTLTEEIYVKVAPYLTVD